MHLLLMALLILAFLALLILLAGSWYLSGVVALPRRASLERARKNETEQGGYGDFDALEKRDYIIRASDGYELHAQHIPAAGESDRYVVITHGYGYNRIGSVKYVHLFRRMGFHCVIYDNRGHGENVRTHVTMGKREHRDLLCVIADTRRRFSVGCLGLHGESMGSATSVMALGARPPVDFLVSDCGYADLTLLLRDLIGKEYRLPAWLVYPASLMSRLRFGFGYGSVMPKDALAVSDVPALFIHGAADTFVLPEHAQLFHEAARGRKRLLIIEGAKHAAALRTDPVAYEAAVRAFLTDCGIL